VTRVTRLIGPRVLLPTFHHVATDRAVWKTGHSRREGGDRLVGSKTPEGLKARVYIDHRFQRTRVEGSSTAGKSTPGESAGGKFETSEARNAEMIHSRSICGRTPVDRSGTPG
jgi:hypothetical protein